MTSQPMSARYHVPRGGTPAQSSMVTDRAMFTEAFVVIPRGCLRDGVISRLPHWRDTRLWILARPLSGFAETFSQYVVEVAPGGGSDRPDSDPRVESALFVVEGRLTLTIGPQEHTLQAGGFAFVPAHTDWRLVNPGETGAVFHWIRKKYEPVDGLGLPEPIVTSDSERGLTPDLRSDGMLRGTQFIDPDDLRYDLQINIVTIEPGGMIPFVETHVMEHGLFVLQGRGLYHLNTEWIEVQEGDFMWLRAFCPQTCIAAGTEPFRYLLYKDVNRHVSFPA